MSTWLPSFCFDVETMRSQGYWGGYHNHVSADCLLCISAKSKSSKFKFKTKILTVLPNMMMRMSFVQYRGISAAV